MLLGYLLPTNYYIHRLYLHVPNLRVSRPCCYYLAGTSMEPHAHIGCTGSQPPTGSTHSPLVPTFYIYEYTHTHIHTYFTYYIHILNDSLKSAPPAVWPCDVGICRRRTRRVRVPGHALLCRTIQPDEEPPCSDRGESRHACWPVKLWVSILCLGIASHSQTRIAHDSSHNHGTSSLSSWLCV